MNKKDKRTYNKNYFIEKIQNNIIFKYHYKERERKPEILKKYGKSELSNTLWGIKKKELRI